MARKGLIREVWLVEREARGRAVSAAPFAMSRLLHHNASYEQVLRALAGTFCCSSWRDIMARRAYQLRILDAEHLSAKPLGDYELEVVD